MSGTNTLFVASPGQYGRAGGCISEEHSSITDALRDTFVDSILFGINLSYRLIKYEYR